MADGTEDVPDTVTATQLLEGFSDAEGDALSVAHLTASDGTVTDNGDGTYSITPTADFNGAVTLTYDVTDGNGGVLPGQTQTYTLDPSMMRRCWPGLARALAFTAKTTTL